MYDYTIVPRVGCLMKSAMKSLRTPVCLLTILMVATLGVMLLIEKTLGLQSVV